MQLDLKEMLDNRVLIGDGGLGTLLQERGVCDEEPFARANLEAPGEVRKAHEEYVEAGATVIETNTFAANRVKLESHGLSTSVKEINREGARLAREAVGEREVMVFGAIGPLGKPLAPVGPISKEAAHEAFSEQAEALVAGGVDALLLETFTDVEELRIAYDVASGFGLPVIAYKSFIEDGERLGDGLPVRVAQEVSGWGVHLVGANCAVGPQRMVSIVEQMSAAVGPVAALPTPGLPQLIDGVVRYNQDPDHFASYGVKLAEAGAHLIGGCCGTTPDHVRALANALEGFEVKSNGSNGSSRRKEELLARAEAKTEEVDTSPQSEFWRSIQRGFSITVEVDLPRGNDISEVIEASRKLKERGIDAIDISDGARARLRMNPVAVAKLIQDEVGIEVVPHMACRDRNIIGLQADLLAAKALGVKNVLAVTGDPVQIGDFPEAASVFDIDSVGLVHALAQMNRGLDLAGNTIAEPAGFLIGASFNPTAEDMDSEIDKLKRKVEAGAHAFWTQPVFEVEALERAMERVGDMDLTILLGMMPLRSSRQAEFLQHEVPGIEVPERIRKRLSELSPEDAPKYGVEVAQEVISRAYEVTAGAYIMPPASAPELAAEVAGAIGDRSKASASR